MPNYIVVGGTRNCGKSTLAASLYVQFKGTGESVGLYEVDTFSDTIPCILGIKPWSERKKRPHGNWNDPLIDVRIREFASDRSELVLGDLPGIIDGLLERMVVPATGAIVIGKDYETLREWERFFESQSIPVLVRIISYLGTPPEIPKEEVIFVGNLNRHVHLDGEVRQVAERLRSFLRKQAVTVA